jgi:MscS family membrane protein
MLNSLLKKPLFYFFLLMILYTGSNLLDFPPEWGLVDSSEFGLKMVIDKGFYLAVICSIFWTILRSVDFVGIKLKDKAAQTESKVDDGLIPFAIDLIKVVIIIFALVTVLGNVFGVNITALIAGLGVGGVAIALASKESIENLLGSFTIFFDKPFVVGDVITLGGVTGMVEKVGFRSTRIRTFDKSIVTVPNKNIINTELDNLGVRPVRRVKFNIGLTYDTTIEQIKNIVNDIQKLVDDHPMTNEDGRVRFLSFGASSLDIMVLYYVNSPEWEDLIDAQQKINYSIIEIVNKHNSEFAFPSTSVYIEKNNSK